MWTGQVSACTPSCKSVHDGLTLAFSGPTLPPVGGMREQCFLKGLAGLVSGQGNNPRMILAIDFETAPG
jgi:hypothetical protein